MAGSQRALFVSRRLLASTLAFALTGPMREVRWAFASQVVTSGANFASSVLLVRAMGIEEFGRYSLGFLTIMIARNFLNAIVLVPMSSLEPSLKRASAAAYRRFALAFAGAFTLLSSLTLLALALALAQAPGYAWLASVALALALANLFANTSDFLRRYFIVTEAAITAFFVDAARFTVQIALIIGYVFATPEQLSVEMALALLAAGSIAGTLVGLGRYGGLRRNRRFEHLMWHRHWRFGRWMLPASMLEAIQGTGPLIIVNALLGDAALGLVRAVQQVANILNLPINTLVQILPSMASRSFFAGGERALRSFLWQSSLTAMGLIGIGFVTLVALSRLVIRSWMDVDALEAVGLLVAFGILTFVTLVRQVLNIYLYVHERSRLVSVANLAGAICSLSLTAWLVGTLAVLAVPFGQTLGLLFGVTIIAVLGCAVGGKTKSNNGW